LRVNHNGLKLRSEIEKESRQIIGGKVKFDLEGFPFLRYFLLFLLDQSTFYFYLFWFVRRQVPCG